MRTAFPRISLAIFGLLWGSCVAETSDGGANEKVDSRAQSLYGHLGTVSCETWQRDLIDSGHARGEQAALTEEYDACIRSHVFHRYVPCEGEDPFEHDDRRTQYLRARDVSTWLNANDVRVDCRDLPSDRLAQASVCSWGNQETEVMEMADHFLAERWKNAVNDWDRAKVAGVIWHEAMHRHGYRHNVTGSECGYASPGFEAASVPGFVGRCVATAGIHSRVIGFEGPGRDAWGHSFAPGVYRGSEPGAWTWNDQLETFQLPAATRLRLCRDEAGTDCTTRTNEAPHEVFRIDFDGYRRNVSRIEVEPLVLAFAAPEYGGTVQSFRAGEYRANSGDLATVGNDHIRSLFVPAGLRVRACAHEGPDGHGQAPCRTHDRPVAGGTYWSLDRSISYLEVEPVVTAYDEPDYFGVRQTFGVGVHSASDGDFRIGDDQIRSLIVPRGLSVTVCDGADGSGDCRTFERSQRVVGTSPTGISRVSVRPALVFEPPGGVWTTVQATGAGSLSFQASTAHASASSRSTP